MTAALTLAKPEHAGVLLPLIAAFHTEEGIDSSDAHRTDAIAPVLEGIPHAVIYLIGPARAPIGYAAVSFGWSIELGGLDGMLDELYVRPGVRGRGIATEVLMTLPNALAQAGLRTIHLEVDQTNAAAQRLYQKAGFRPRERYVLMSRAL